MSRRLASSTWSGAAAVAGTTKRIRLFRLNRLNRAKKLDVKLDVKLAQAAASSCELVCCR